MWLVTSQVPTSSKGCAGIWSATPVTCLCSLTRSPTVIRGRKKRNDGPRMVPTRAPGGPQSGWEVPPATSLFLVVRSPVVGWAIGRTLELLADQTVGAPALHRQAGVDTMGVPCCGVEQSGSSSG